MIWLTSNQNSKSKLPKLKSCWFFFQGHFFILKLNHFFHFMYELVNLPCLWLLQGRTFHLPCLCWLTSFVSSITVYCREVQHKAIAGISWIIRSQQKFSLHHPPSPSSGAEARGDGGTGSLGEKAGRCGGAAAAAVTHLAACANHWSCTERYPVAAKSRVTPKAMKWCVLLEGESVSCGGFLATFPDGLISVMVKLALMARSCRC